ncbi:polymerase II transcription elongation factor [Mycena indigotica]|uniref:Polymerase II transcription elongation factor n=1 Tax=Mycena indigotica TaxID=2126181 RepID=A0A8H6VPT0_9AGAR|nr:polymerase II transcription elongation factor [Mycena indigotica]KAF7289214.1 polymerase II transcription elongation factor [Mycena indigotica]
MGMRGYRVYRYKRRYFVTYNHYDSDPTVFGVRVKNEVPSDAADYQLWLATLRQKLEKELEAHAVDKNASDFGISHRPPVNDILIEWIYELDLDNELFLVDNCPIFSLKNIPANDKVFCACIGFDSYGHRSYSPWTPVKYRGSWVVDPPLVDQAAIVAYAALEPEIVGINAILDLPPGREPLQWELTRVAFYEIVVGGRMRADSFAPSIHVLQTVSDRRDIPLYISSWGAAVLRLGIRRLDLNSIENGEPGSNRDIDSAPVSAQQLLWIVPNTVCVRFCTHLNDERVWKKEAREMAHEMEQVKSETVFGILFSLFHCAIMKRVDGNLQVTRAMQFLPSLHADNPSTPGIAAVARLGLCKALHKPSVSCVTRNSLPGHFLSSVPPEIIQHIVEDLSPTDLDHLSWAAPAIFEPHVNTLLCRYSYVGEYRLDRVLPESVPSNLSEDENRQGSPSGLPAVHSRYFAATFLGRPQSLEAQNMADIPKLQVMINSDMVYLDYEDKSVGNFQYWRDDYWDRSRDDYRLLMGVALSSPHFGQT